MPEHICELTPCDYVRTNLLAAAVYPVWRLFDAWSESKEIDTDIVSQV